jgi:NADPH2:quinone reductase
MRAIRISEWGGPEVLELVEDAPVPEPGEQGVLVRVSAAGVNFADTHARENSYLARYELPLVPGAEVAGVVERDGGGFSAGERVVGLVGTGGYAEFAVAPAASTFRVPDGIADGTALALMLQGLTAWHLYRTCARLERGERVVVHAAAGGVGSLAVQLGKAFGAGRVIATASTEEKRALAVLEMAGGRVFEAGLAALAPLGRMVVYGMASGEANQVSSGALMRRSQAVVGFWLMHCLRRPAELVDPPLQELFGRAAARDLRVVEGEVYGLSEAARAHAELQARRTVGKLLLDPAR